MSEFTKKKKKKIILYYVIIIRRNWVLIVTKFKLEFNNKGLTKFTSPFMGIFENIQEMNYTPNCIDLKPVTIEFGLFFHRKNKWEH